MKKSQLILIIVLVILLVLFAIGIYYKRVYLEPQINPTRKDLEASCACEITGITACLSDTVPVITFASPCPYLVCAGQSCNLKYRCYNKATGIYTFYLTSQSGTPIDYSTTGTCKLVIG